MPLGAASPATASGDFDEEHYSLHVSGDAELARLLNIAQALGIGTPGVGLAGPAQLDVDLAGSWMGFAPPAPSGTIQLNTVTAELQGVSEPLLIDSASVSLQNQLVNVTSFAAAFAKGTALGGSASFPGSLHRSGELRFSVRCTCRRGLAQPAESVAQPQFPQTALVSPAGNWTAARRRLDEVAAPAGTFPRPVLSSAR